MAALNAWQRIDRVIQGRPFGDGSTGAYTSGTIPSLTNRSCSGTATSTTLTIASNGYTDGDIILIHQTRGTGAGQWEINKIVSGGGTTSLTLQEALQYTYTDSGSSQAQVISVPMYSSVNVSSGTWTVPDWDGDTGGILAIACNGTFSHAGSITASAKGFRGGAGRNDGGAPATQGESTLGTGTTSTSANGSAGGGGNSGGAGRNQGGGGGYATSGETAAGGNGGSGGSTIGSADLTTLVFGGAGGGGRANNGESVSAGGDSGGIVVLFVKNITGDIAVTANGANTSDAGNADGGGGAGGSVLIVCQLATLGSSTITAVGGDDPDLIAEGGNGRIAVHHSAVITGTTSPTFEDVEDPTLIEANAGFIFNMI